MRDDTGDCKENNEVFPFKEYLKINLIMWAFCLVVVMFAYLFTDAGEVIGFLFGFLAIGFSVVSIYDWLFDRYIKEI